MYVSFEESAEQIIRNMRFSLFTAKVFPDGWVKVYKGITTTPVLSYRFIVAGTPSVVPGGAGLGASKAKTVFDDVKVWENSGL